MGRGSSKARAVAKAKAAAKVGDFETYKKEMEKATIAGQKSKYTRTKTGSELIAGDTLYTASFTNDKQRNGWTLLDGGWNSKTKVVSNVEITEVKRQGSWITLTGTTRETTQNGRAIVNRVRKRFSKNDKFLVAKK